MRPLVFSVEDDLNIQNVIRIALENSQIDVLAFTSANQMLAKLEETLPDVLLLDIILPGMDGLQLIKKLKKNDKYKNIPIMVISAKTTEIDKVIGIDLGADDYMAKPFGVLEMVSRVKALLRRNKNTGENEVLEINGLVLDKKEHQVLYKEKTVDLTNKQFDLLEYLMQRHKRLISREELLNNIWGYDFVGETRTIDVHIKEIRNKLKLAGIEQPTIETVRGIGYKFIL
ncbi:MAG: winged helix-turn-helix domain-containing protein [Candidatus Izemoplasmatales bacterium]|jgi:two-component system alkaline phosphatase synthesis response regulator PhoP